MVDGGQRAKCQCREECQPYHLPVGQSGSEVGQSGSEVGPYSALAGGLHPVLPLGCSALGDLSL